MDQQQINYARIEQAITFIKANFQSQPSLEDIATYVNLSPFHFQRLFSDWAGVSPKKFMQYISIEYAKDLLKNGRCTLLDTAYKTGLSGTGRLHDLFVTIEKMTPGEYKNGGENLKINYCIAKSPFGKMIVASTTRGVCHIAFEEEQTQALTALEKRFPNATYHPMTDRFQQDALLIFEKDWTQLDTIKLHISGTPFQLKVWESLLRIPTGNLTSYGNIAKEIGKPKASRAVGTAIGSNPIAFLIPCHRVIQGTGNIGGYMWGATRKSAIIGWEAAHSEI